MSGEKGNKKRTALMEMLYEKRENKQTQDKLEREAAAKEAKEEFYSKISGNLQTPINTIMGLIQLIRITEDISPELENKLDKIDISCQYLCSLLNNILGMSEIEHGELNIQVSPFSIDRLVRRIEYMISFQAEEKGISYESSIKVNNRIFIGDFQKIELIINNLMENAIKFTDNNGWVAFFIDELEERDNTVSLRFRVQDNGIGIGENDYEKIFQPFEKLEKDSSNLEGIGLGLSLSARLTERMGGKICVKSIPQKGTEFSFILKLPLGHVEDVEGEYDLETGLAEVKPADGEFEGMRVLLAEDNNLNAEIVISLLAHEKIIVEHAVNGKEAADKFCSNPEGYYDIILMDIQMPVINGWEAVRRIRESGKKDADTVFVAAMTADASGESRQRAMQTGMNDFIAKPFEINEIYKILRKIKGNRKQT